MAEIELFSPAVRVDVGPYRLTSGVGLEVYSSRKTRRDWAQVRLSDAYAGAVQITEDMPAVVRLGYGGALQTVLSGKVASCSATELLVYDDTAKLDSVTVTDTYLDVTPQELVGVVLRAAGVTEYEIDPTPYPPRSVVPVRCKTGTQVLQQINKLWGISAEYRFLGGCFYWGTGPIQDNIYHFEYGKNILDLTCTGGVWTLQTVSVPFIRHSDKIAVTAPQISGIVTVQDVRYTLSQAGFVRSVLRFEGGDNI